MVEGAVAMTGAPVSLIRTPDQRLRIFVSSTLKELEPERVPRAPRSSACSSHPSCSSSVPAPPAARALSRVLEQSDVFVGIYWQEYGWIAPDEEISGLEDEYRAAPREMPKLVYVKQPAEREERLGELVRTSATTTRRRTSRSRPPTSSPSSWRATSRRCSPSDSTRRASAPQRDDRRSGRGCRGRPSPAPHSEAVGREGEVTTLFSVLVEDARRLVTLVGPGGVGKPPRDRGGTQRRRILRPCDVRDARARADPGDVLPAIARDLGERDDTATDPRTARAARSGRRDLIVLDNFEQVVERRPTSCRF